jgi:hypothetical protein
VHNKYLGLYTMPYGDGVQKLSLVHRMYYFRQGKTAFSLNNF